MLPRALALMVGVFFLMPLTSLMFHGTPWALYSQQGLWPMLLVLVTYWVAPWGLVGAILFKRLLFFPFYLFQCAMLVWHTYAFGHSLPWDLLVVRYLMVASMAYLGLLLTNRDFLFPFLSKNGRAWRKARRYDAEVGLHLTEDEGKVRVDALMENCSATGMGIRIPKDRNQKGIKRLRPGHHTTVHVDRVGLEVALPVEVVWFYEYPDYWSLGLRVLDTEAMIRFVASLTGVEDRASPLKVPHTQLLESDMRQTAFLLWMIFIALSFGMPAFA